VLVSSVYLRYAQTPMMTRMMMSISMIMTGTTIAAAAVPQCEKYTVTQLAFRK